MPKENNKMQVDIDTLKKQNVNDLLSIKELYKRIEELEEKTSQIKYIDNTLVKKIKKEYEKLKKIILDENIQVQLYNKIDNFNKKLNKDIETINLQMKSIEITKLNFFITPEMFGAVGDGVTDDTQALQDMINFAKNNHHSVMKSQKWRTYLITEGLSLGAYQKFDFSGATIKVGCPMNYAIKLNTSNNNWGCMENINIDCNGLANQGIITEWTSMYRFKDIKITNPVKYGIYAKTGNGIYNHILIENLIENNTPTGICLNGTDSKLDSVHIKNCKIGIDNNGGINYFNNVHAWIVIPKLIPNSIAFSIKGSAVLTNCYADTYYIAVRNDNEQLLNINGLHVFSNPNYITKENLNDKEPYVFYLTQDINKVDPYANSIRKTIINGLTCDMTLTGFTNKAKFSNIDGETFTEKINNYSLTNSNKLSSSMLDNLPTSYLTSEFKLIDDNYTITTNKLVKKENNVIGDLILTVKDKSLLTAGKQFTLASIPSGYYPSYTFYTTATFGTDGGTSCSICPLLVLSSSTSGQKQLKITIPDIFSNIANANRLRVHINYNL